MPIQGGVKQVPFVGASLMTVIFPLYVVWADTAGMLNVSTMIAVMYLSKERRRKESLSKIFIVFHMKGRHSRSFHSAILATGGTPGIGPGSS